MMPATSTASPALQTAKTIALQIVRSPRRLATMVAAIAPAATGHRALGPSAIRTPAATPAAGQNTATPSGLVSNKRLNRAARKYAIAIAAVWMTRPAQRLVASDAAGNL